MIERDGKQQDIKLPVNLIEKLIESKRKKGLLLQLRLPTYVGKYGIKDDTVYGKIAGLREMDKIVAIDSIPVQFYDEMPAILKDHKNGQVVLTVERNGELLQLNSRVTGEGKIGIPVLDDDSIKSLGVYNTETRKYGFLCSLSGGCKKIN